MANPVWTLLGSAATGAASLNSIPITVGSNQPAGTILVALVSCGASTITINQIQDSRNLTNWQADAVGPASNRRVFASSFKPASLLQTGDTVTVTFSANTTDRNLQVYAVSNLNQTTWFAGSGSGSGTSAAPAATVSGLTAANHYGIAAICCFNNAGTAFTAGTDGHAGTLTKLLETSSGTSFHLASEAGLDVTGQTSFVPDGAITSTSWTQLALAYNIVSGGSKAVAGAAAGIAACSGAVSDTSTVAGSAAAAASCSGAVSDTSTVAGSATGRATVGSTPVGDTSVVAGSAAGVATVAGVTVGDTSVVSGSAAGRASVSGDVLGPAGPPSLERTKMGAGL